MFVVDSSGRRSDDSKRERMLRAPTQVNVDDKGGLQIPEAKPARDFAQLPRAEEPPHVTRVGSSQVFHEVRISRRAVLGSLPPGRRRRLAYGEAGPASAGRL